MHSEKYDDPLQIVRHARAAVKEANARAARMQNQTTQQLQQRVKDLKYWSNEIDRELQDMKDENEDLVRCYRRLGLSLEITGKAGRCNESCFAVRRKKVQVERHLWKVVLKLCTSFHCQTSLQKGIGDVGSDRVDQELHKEKDLVSESTKQMKELGAVIERQLETNQATRKAMIRDLTLKQEAISLDNRSVSMGSEAVKNSLRTPDGDRLEYRAPDKVDNDKSNDEPRDPEDGAPLQRMSEYQEWIENTANNLNYSAKARVNSRKIGQRMLQVLRELAQQMRNEAIAIESLLKDSIRTWTEWRDSLQAQVAGKDKEMRSADAAIDEITFSLKQKGGPLQVALNRQSQRGLRPGIELCNDKAQYALHQELMMLKSSLLALENQLDKSKESRKRLGAERDRLKGKLEVCEQNLVIDNEILRVIRSTFPPEIQLTGFLLSETK